MTGWQDDRLAGGKQAGRRMACWQEASRIAGRLEGADRMA
jgi:hypothetical protein